MSVLFQFETPRLLLRAFKERDRVPFAALNADPEVMRFFTSTWTAEQSNGHIDRYQEQLARDGFSFCVAEHRQTGEFLGIVGMQTMYFAVPNLPQPAVELGWRLAKQAHNQGFATEAARVFVDHAFGELHLPRVVAITATSNQPSRRVMEKLGMRHRPELTFDHPIVPLGHALQQHVLYDLERPGQT